MACDRSALTTTERQIQLSPSKASKTRTFISEDTFNAEGNQIRVYDYYVPSSGSAYHYFDGDLNGDGVKDGEGDIVEYNGSDWPFLGGKYNWTADGVHNFFGWLEKTVDPDTKDTYTVQDLFGDDFAFIKERNILSFPMTSIDHTTPQFDFMYSDIHHRNLNVDPYFTSVPLNFHHMFTAVSFGADNTTNSTIEIKEFRIEKILNRRSLSIDFNGTDPVLTYTDASQNQYLTRSSDSFTLGPETSIKDIFTNSNSQSFMMLWPLESTYLYCPDPVEDLNANGEIEYSEYPSDYKMYIKYQVGGATYEKRMNFSDVPWVSGKCYHYDIIFADKAVELIFVVKEWDYQHQDVDYTDASVGVESTGVLTWDGTVSLINETQKTVTIVNAQPAKGTFTIKAPLGGSWMISLSGDVNAFEVTPDNAEINGKTSHISVKPLISDPKRDYTVKLKFAVRRADGRIITADREVQPIVYTIVLPQNN